MSDTAVSSKLPVSSNGSGVGTDSPNNAIMSPRLLAQDAVKWYKEELDPTASHSLNIQSTFRPAVLALTHFIVSDKKPRAWTDLLEDALHQTMTETSQASDGTEKLTESKSTTSEVAALPVLDRRATARLDAFLNGVVWAVPSSMADVPSRKTNEQNKPKSKTTPEHGPTVSLMDGLSGFARTPKKESKPSISPLNGSSLLRSISSTGASGSSRDVPTRPQIRNLDLTVRLELYLRTLFRVNKGATYEPCVLAAEPPRALKARVEAIVTAFSETVGTVRQQGPVLTRLVFYMTLELLAVPCLSESCKAAIRRLVVDYEHQTSFASLAFLSSPDDAADQKLVPLLQRYFSTLKGNWETAVRDCELEDMLSTVLDKDMRHFFKTVEFTSIGHLLTCAHEYRSLLQKIELPPTYAASSSDKTQLQDESHIRQAIRDLQRERITINGNLLPTVRSRTELCRLMSQTLNSAALTPGAPKSRRKSRRKKGMRRSGSEPSFVHSKTQSPSTQPSQNGQMNGPLDDDPDDISSTSANESEGDSLADSTVSSRSSSRRSFDVSTVDLLTKRLLLASSRTGTGGDAYFIVRDLFGGKDVQVLSHQQPRGLGGTPATTIELWAHLGSLEIKTHTSFDVYPLLQERGNRDPYAIMDHCEPLIQLHTTTTEVITLKEVRASDADGFSNDGPHHVDQDGGFVLQERITSKTGWRTLSIRPALYEKLEVWTTPS